MGAVVGGTLRKTFSILMVADVAGYFVTTTGTPRDKRTAGTLRGSHMRGLTILVSTTVLLAGLAITPAARAQISINIGVQPVCSYGYYGYAPYACAPRGYYGSGYFYNGIFLGMGPWAGWGYGHGWGGHRFSGDGGGRYHGGMGRATYGGHSSNRGENHGGGARPGAGHGMSHASAPHGGASHGDGGHAHGGGSHGGGGSHDGGHQ